MCHAHITLFQQGCTFCSAQTLVAPVLAAPLPQDKAQKPWEKMKPFQPHLPAGPTRSCERRNISRSCSVAQQPWSSPQLILRFPPFCLARLNPANWRGVGSMPAELCSLRKQTVPSAGFP